MTTEELEIIDSKSDTDYTAITVSDLNEIKKVAKRIKLDSEEAGINRLANMKRDIPFTDYAVEPPESFIFEASIRAIPMSSKKALIRKATIEDRAGVAEIDFDRLNDLMVAWTFGFDEKSWELFKQNHPVGLSTKLQLIANEVNGESVLSEEDIEELKNLAGQEV